MAFVEKLHPLCVHGINLGLLGEHRGGQFTKAILRMINSFRLHDRSV
jgi:hypothetical protein